MAKQKKNMNIVVEPVAQSMITRLPYAKSYDPDFIFELTKKVDEKGLVSISVPIHTENPGNALKLITQLQDKGLFLVSVISLHRDRHIVTSRSKRLTNSWEPIAVFSRSKDYVIDRDGPARPKRGVSGREEQFDEDEFLTCVGDHWPIRSDKRDRRLLPGKVTLNLIQLAGLTVGDKVIDPYGNPAIKEQCELLGVVFIDGQEKSVLRDDWNKKKIKKQNDLDQGEE